jgi:hypothetical protein
MFMNDLRNRNLQAWILVFGVLLILSLLALGAVYALREITRAINQSAQQAVAPVNNLGTQVANFLHPSPTVLPDPVTVIREVRSLARLETIQYTVEKVITAETNQGTFGFLFGDRLIFVAHGVVVAGVDLSKMEPEDMRVEDGVLYVRLPEPEVFIATLDNDKSYVYNRDTGLLTAGDVNLETTARQAAEAEIRNAAIEDGILEQARLNSENYLYRLFIALGYPDVIFEEGGATPSPSPTP